MEMHIEFLLEEESAAEALRALLPRIIRAQVTHKLHVFQGKKDLLQRLPARLAGYAKWIPAEYRIVVLVDCDSDDCRELKRRLDSIATRAGLVTRTSGRGGRDFRVLNRIAVEELEAWFFGDMDALRRAYPRVPAALERKTRFRDPDRIRGGTWEALEHVLRDAGYYATGLPKIAVARRIATIMDPDRNRSRSFQCFRDGLRGLVA